MKRALIVIDIQTGDGWHAPGINIDEDKTRITKAIQETLSLWREKNEIIVFVIYVQQDREKAVSGQETQLQRRKSGKCLGCDRQDRLAEFLAHRHEPYEPVFFKACFNAFTNGNLSQYLKSQNVAEVVLMGSYTFACVRATAIGAQKAGFRVRLLARCVYPPFSDKRDENRWLREIRNTLKSNSPASIAVL